MRATVRAGVWLAALLLASPPARTAGEAAVTVTTRGGDSIQGTVLDESLVIKTGVGSITVRMDSIRSVQFGPPDEIATVGGTVLKGEIELEKLRIKTEFGEMAIAKDRLASIVAPGKEQQQPKPPQPAPDATTRLPDRYGVYAVRSDGLLRLSGGGRTEDLPDLPGSAEILVFDKLVPFLGLDPGNPVCFVPLTFVRNTVVGKVAFGMSAKADDFAVIPCNQWRRSGRRRSLPAELGPVPGQNEMLRVAPRATLPPGVYEVENFKAHFAVDRDRIAVEPFDEWFLDSTQRSLSGGRGEMKPTSVLDGMRGTAAPPAPGAPKQPQQPPEARVRGRPSGPVEERFAPPVPGGGPGPFRHGTLVARQGESLVPAPTPKEATHTHPGADFVVAAEGAPVRAMCDGVVVETIADPKDPDFRFLGYMVLLRHAEGIGGRETYSSYLHLKDAPGLRPGQEVRHGDAVGSVGTTGAREGAPHCHVEIRHFPSRYCEDPGWMPLKEGEPAKNVFGRGDQRFAWRFFENWEDPLQLVEDFERCIADRLSPESFYSVVEAQLREGDALLKSLEKEKPEAKRKPYRKANLLYLDALRRIRGAEFLFGGDPLPEKTGKYRMVVFFNLGCYWAGIEEDKEEALRWLEASFGAGLLQKLGRRVVDGEPMLQSLREDPRFQDLMKKHAR